jgi:two-component system, cell cycle response regulator
MSGSSRARAGLDVVPLSQRVGAVMVLRLTLCLVLAVVAVSSDAAPVRLVAETAAGYLLASGLLSALALVRVRAWAVRAFGTSLLLDAVLLQVQHEVIGHAAAADTAIAVYLMAVCLLGSFRSGLKIGVWQSMLMVAAVRAEQSGVLPMPGWAAGMHLPGRTVPGRDLLLAGDIALVWLTVLTASAAAAINERELRRRRYDAEALHRFATGAQTDTTPAQVAERLCGFVVDELLAGRALVCRNTEQGWSLVAGSGAVQGLPLQATPSASALLTQPTGPEREVLTLRLDPIQDPWLASRLPGARRLVSLSLEKSPRERWWLVFEHGARRGSRVERRVISTAAQAAATATLALSRARLLDQAERAASTDGLTGVANRRIFDQLLADLVGQFVATGAPFALVMADVDQFKSINDRYGHQTGDQVLQAVARTLTSYAGTDAVPARYGGEEFAVLVPGGTVEKAVELAELFRIGLRAGGGPVPVTASFGVAGFPADARDAEELVWRADAALMHAKQTGRDRVVRADRMDGAVGLKPSSPGR